MASKKNVVKTETAAGGDELPAGVFTDAELEILASAFRERGGFQTSPELFVHRVEEEEEGRTESVIPMNDLIYAFNKAGFTTVKDGANYVILAKKISDGMARVVKIYNGSKRRIRWKTVLL